MLKLIRDRDGFPQKLVSSAFWSMERLSPFQSPQIWSWYLEIERRFLGLRRLQSCIALFGTHFETHLSFQKSHFNTNHPPFTFYKVHHFLSNRRLNPGKIFSPTKIGPFSGHNWPFLNSSLLYFFIFFDQKKSNYLEARCIISKCESIFASSAISPAFVKCISFCAI